MIMTCLPSNFPGRTFSKKTQINLKTCQL